MLALASVRRRQYNDGVYCGALCNHSAPIGNVEFGRTTHALLQHCAEQHAHQERLGRWSNCMRTLMVRRHVFHLI